MLHRHSPTSFLTSRQPKQSATRVHSKTKLGSSFLITDRFRRLFHRVCLVSTGCALAVLLPVLLPTALAPAVAQSSGGAIQLKAARVEANSNTGVVTAIGNVRIDYPSREIFATAAQAQYYSREQRIVLNGNVDVIQEGNTLQAETVTYLIEEGKFVATPGTNSQVEAVYILPEEETSPNATESSTTSPEAGNADATTPAPLSIPSPPDELPTDLSSFAVDD